MSAEMIAVTAEPQIVRRFFAEMLGESTDATGRENCGETRPLRAVGPVRDDEE